MKAVFIHGPDDVRIDDIAAPVAGINDVLIKLAACGICGSDLTYAKFGGVNGPAGPMALGHELSGIVETVGAQVKIVKPGQRVIVNPYANGIGNGGPEGGFAHYLLVRGVDLNPASVMPIPDHLSFEHAALIEPLAVALHGVNRGRVQADNRVVIFGAGPIGLGMVVGMKHRGVTDIVVVDYSAMRLERALAVGARAVINPTNDDLRNRLAELHGEHLHFGLPVVGTDVYLDAAGAPGIVPSIIEFCKLNARLVITALHKSPIAVDFRQVLAKEMDIVAAMGYPDEYPEVMEILMNRKIDVEPMISHRIGFEEFTAAFKLASDPNAAAKVMITF